MYINKIQYAWKQNGGASILGSVQNYYNLFCFSEPVDVNVEGTLIHTRPNACIFTEPKHPRGFYFLEQTSMHWLHAYKEIRELLQKYQIPLNSVFYPKDPELVADLFRKLRLEFLDNRPLRDEMIRAYTQALVIALSRTEQRSAVTSDFRNSDHGKLHALRREILSNPEKKWTVAEMAQKVCMSPSRFHAVYKAVFETSPMKDVIHSKIDCAKSMLVLDEHITLSAVAERLGYTNQYHFIRQFKETAGISPGAYRKKKR